MRIALIIFCFFLCSCTKAQYVFALTGTATPLNLTNAEIIADGNSYTQGNGYTPYSTVIMTLSPFSSNGSTMANFGVGGQTTIEMLADQSSQILSRYTSGHANIILFQEGGNDLYFNGDVTSAFDNIKTYCLNARTVGYKIIISTLIHRDQTTSFGDTPTEYNDKIDSLNADLIADSSFYDGIIRPDLESIFNTYTSGGYDADKVHPNQTGQNLYAALYAAAMQILIE